MPGHAHLTARKTDGVLEQGSEDLAQILGRNCASAASRACRAHSRDACPSRCARARGSGAVRRRAVPLAHPGARDGLQPRARARAPLRPPRRRRDRAVEAIGRGGRIAVPFADQAALRRKCCERRLHAVREIGGTLARALHVRLASGRKIVDRLGQRLDFARIAGAQPFRRVVAQGRQFVPQPL